MSFWFWIFFFVSVRSSAVDELEDFLSRNKNLNSNYVRSLNVKIEKSREEMRRFAPIPLGVLKSSKSSSSSDSSIGSATAGFANVRVKKTVRFADGLLEPLNYGGRRNDYRVRGQVEDRVKDDSSLKHQIYLPRVLTGPKMVSEAESIFNPPNPRQLPVRTLDAKVKQTRSSDLRRIYITDSSSSESESEKIKRNLKYKYTRPLTSSINKK